MRKLADDYQRRLEAAALAVFPAVVTVESRISWGNMHQRCINISVEVAEGLLAEVDRRVAQREEP